VFFAGVWAVQNALTVWNVHDDRRQKTKAVALPAVGRIVMAGGEAETCNHDPIGGRCVLCGTPIDLEPDER
jgi:hypothetical protein